MNELKVISMLVENNSGVTTRVTSLFERQGYNIHTFTGCPTNDENYSVITISAYLSDEQIRPLVLKIKKLESVLEVKLLDKEKSVFREILLIKLRTTDEAIKTIKEVVDIYEGHILDLSPNTMILEVSGKSQKIDAFLRFISRYDIREVCRTGITGMSI